MWNFFKGVFAGKNHVDDNFLCQDYADYNITENGIYLGALSDGASASAFADIAASCNVNAFINCLHKVDYHLFFMWQDTQKVSYILNSCRQMINKYMSRIKDSSPIDFAATLLFIVSDGSSAVIGHLGDGVACGVSRDKKTEVLSFPKNIRGQSDKTYFTVSSDAEKVFEIVIIDDIDKYDAIILMSDGPETSFYNSALKNMYQSNLLSITDTIASERARDLELTYFLKSNFWKRGITSDDCSMIVFTRGSDA